MKKIIIENEVRFRCEDLHNKNLDEIIEYFQSKKVDNQNIILNIDLSPSYSCDLDEVRDNSLFHWTREETDEEYNERIEEEKAADYRKAHFQRKDDMKEYERIKEKYNLK